MTANNIKYSNHDIIGIASNLFWNSKHHYRPQRSWAKVIFSHACVCPQGGLPQCMLGYTPHPQEQEQTPPHGGRPPGSRHTPQKQTPPRSRHPPSRSRPPPGAADSSIRSTSGRYASYWNAFLYWNNFAIWVVLLFTLTSQLSYKLLHIKNINDLQHSCRTCRGSFWRVVHSTSARGPAADVWGTWTSPVQNPKTWPPEDTNTHLFKLNEVFQEIRRNFNLTRNHHKNDPTQKETERPKE